MSFLKGVKSTIDVPVKAVIPALDENDQPIEIEVSFIATYTRFKRSQSRDVGNHLANLTKEMREAFESGDFSAVSGQVAYFDSLLRENLKGWRNLPSPDGGQVPFTPEALEEAIEDTYYAAALLGGLRRALGWGDAGDAAGALEAKNS